MTTKFELEPNGRKRSRRELIDGELKAVHGAVLTQSIGIPMSQYRAEIVRSHATGLIDPRSRS
jgi:hypothetical protein